MDAVRASFFYAFEAGVAVGEDPLCPVLCRMRGKEAFLFFFRQRAGIVFPDVVEIDRSDRKVPFRDGIHEPGAVEHGLFKILFQLHRHYVHTP